MRFPSRHPWLGRAAAAAALLLAACSPAPSGKIPASSKEEYDTWFSQAVDSFPADQLRLVREAQQEIKLAIMSDTSASGENEVEAAFLAKVNGMSVPDFERLGLEDRIHRLTGERDEAQHLLDQNSKLKSPPGDDTAAASLAARLDEDRERVQNAANELAATQADLAKLDSHH